MHPKRLRHLAAANPEWRSLKATFFNSSHDFRRWLEQNHALETELWLGFHKRHTARAGLTYKQAVDEALCFGWIDGLVKRIDGECYQQRFTPRKPRSIWSNINIKRVEELMASGRMLPAGLKAYQARVPNRSGIYQYESRARELDAAFAKKFKLNGRAWAFFQAQPPGYQRKTTWWVVSAKKEETRRRRLDQLIRESAKGKRIASLD